MTSIELNGCVGPDELPSLARRWFEAAARVLFADVIAGLVDGQVSLPRSRPGVGDAPWGEPGSMWAATVRIVSEGSPLVRLGCEFGSFPLARGIGSPG